MTDLHRLEFRTRQQPATNERWDALLRLPYVLAADAGRDVENWSRLLQEAGWKQQR